MNVQVHGLFLLVLLSAIAPGCGPAVFEDIRNGIQVRGHYIEGVPFVRQEEHSCGPAALASVLSYWKRPVELEVLTRSIVLPQLRGTLPMDMEKAARDRGFRTTTAHGDRDLLLSSLRRDVPVICLLDLGIGPLQQPHYVTIIGFDDRSRLFVMHDGASRDRTMTFEDFARSWARAGNWMLVVEP